MVSNTKASAVHVEEPATSEHHEIPVKHLQPFEVLAHKPLHLYDEHGNLRLIPTPSADPNGTSDHQGAPQENKQIAEHVHR